LVSLSNLPNRFKPKAERSVVTLTGPIKPDIERTITLGGKRTSHRRGADGAGTGTRLRLTVADLVGSSIEMAAPESDIDLARRAGPSFDISSPLDPELFADDFVFQPSVTGSETVGLEYVGQAGWRDYQKAALEVWSSLKPEVGDLRSLAPGVVLGDGILHGVGRTSGVPVTTPVFALIRIRDGRIAELRIFQTQDEALKFAESAGEARL
jgi:ketosteroid isomerase-like protein